MIPTQNGNKLSLVTLVSSLKEVKCRADARKVIHSVKLGIALVLVSLLYLVNSLFEQVGENAMWAIMTVVVILEFYAGATLGKGINRGIGTVVGGGLGCLIAMLGDEIGGFGNAVVIACSVLVFGACATYCRLVPRLKKRHDYGFMIFILTFSLVALSGMRDDKVVEVARDRLATIGLGFAVCVFVSLFIFPIWASDELHNSTASKFDKLATSIQGCLDEYFNMTSEKENHQDSSGGSGYIQDCKSVLNSKSNDESLVNHAKWEPWHGKFGLNYPWDKYLEIGDHLRELAANIISLRGCLQSPKQPSPVQRLIMKEPCENFMLSIQCMMRDIGECIRKMELCQTKVLITPRLQSMKLQLTPQCSTACNRGDLETDENQAIASFNFMLMEIVEKVEVLAKKVEELGELTNFPTMKIDV